MFQCPHCGSRTFLAQENLEQTIQIFCNGAGGYRVGDTVDVSWQEWISLFCEAPGCKKEVGLDEAKDVYTRALGLPAELEPAGPEVSTLAPDQEDANALEAWLDTVLSREGVAWIIEKPGLITMITQDYAAEIAAYTEARQQRRAQQQPVEGETTTQ